MNMKDGTQCDAYFNELDFHLNASVLFLSPGGHEKPAQIPVPFLNLST